MSYAQHAALKRYHSQRRQNAQDAPTAPVDAPQVPPAPRLRFTPMARQIVARVGKYDIVRTAHPFEDKLCYMLYAGNLPVAAKDTEHEARMYAARLLRVDPEIVCPF
jgi:hypothetical protein